METNLVTTTGPGHSMSGATHEAARRLRAVILLGGGVRPTELVRSIGRSVLDLPLDASETVLRHWAKHIADFAADVGRSSVVVRLLIDQAAVDPAGIEPLPTVDLRVENDPDSLRGTAGLLADVTRHYADDDLILAGNAAQLLLRPLPDLFRRLAEPGADATVITHRDGSPAGLMLFRCGCLREVPEIGYVDLKEQVLPDIAKRESVAIVECERRSGIPVRTRRGYLAAVAARHGWNPDDDDPYREASQVRFSFVEDGAHVDPTARVHDAVLLSGATLGPGAVVARSVVCPGAVIPRNRRVVDRVVSAR